ncbi:hypothetical protein GC174_13015 [bacterium]|nr:hypothetical protein [bacterium]
MEEIDKKYLDRLRDSGLHVSPPIPAYSGGVWIKKPTSTKGHFVPGYSSDYISFEEKPEEQPDTNAPMIAFYRNRSAWVVDLNGSQESVSPADFLNEWATPEEAVDDILDFYFGDSARMIEFAYLHGKFLGRSEAFKSMEAESQSKNS